jgi:signal peptidase I
VTPPAASAAPPAASAAPPASDAPAAPEGAPAEIRPDVPTVFGAPLSVATSTGGGRSDLDDDPATRGGLVTDVREPNVTDAPDLDEDDDEDDARRRTRNAVEWIAVAVGAVIVAFLIRAFLLQAFYIPSESMEPTLRENDRILVNKLSYKLHDINRGDLVVFEKPPNEPASDINDLIKRVIARPGETIELHTDGTITIDGRLLEEPYLADGQAPGPMTMTRDTFVDGACTNPIVETTKCTLGEDFVFVMGDNRNHSHDSRMFGPIDEDLVVGRAFVKVWPLSKIGFL